MTQFIKLTLTLSILFLSFVHAAAPVVSFPAEAPGEIRFIGNAGSDNVFTVERWKFTEVKNLDAPERIRVRAELDMTSLQTGWQELLVSLKKKKDYFHVKKYAVATVTIDGATALEDGSYRADAQLTLKGITKLVALNFTLVETDGAYHVEASGEITRQDFGFTGGGPKDVVPITVAADLTVAR